MILEILNERRNISSGGADESIFGYSRAVGVGADVHVSGTCAPAGHEQSDAYTRTRAALTIIEAALAEAGAGLEHAVRTVVYVRDIADADGVARRNFRDETAAGVGQTDATVAALE